MPRFVAIGYGDQTGYDRTSHEVRTAAHLYDDRLKRHGALIGTVGAPVQVRNPDGAGTEVIKAAFMSTSLPIAGISVFEAADVREAIEMASHTPCAVVHGVVEVWPIEGS